MKEQIINHFLNYEFIYIFSFCSLVFLSLSIIIKKEIIKKISMLLFSICFILFLFEFVLSFYMIRYEKSEIYNNTININHSNIIEKKRDVAFVDKLSKEIYKFGNKKIGKEYFNEKKYIKVFDIEYSFYKETKFRYTECNECSNEAYVFLGCSFTFGDGLYDDDTLPYYFSKKNSFNYKVINYGISGKGSNSALSIVKTGLKENIKYKHFFYSLMGDHIYRNFRYTATASCDGFLYKNNEFYIPTNIGKIKYIFARSYIFRKVFLPLIDDYNQEYYEDYMIKSLKEINKIVEEQYNSKLTIIVWYDYYSDRFLKKLKETNLDLIFLPDYFNEENEYRIKYDGHPATKANKEIAEILYNHIEKEEIK